jgi:hypothetical protein
LTKDIAAAVVLAQTTDSAAVTAVELTRNADNSIRVLPRSVRDAERLLVCGSSRRRNSSS